ncbi:hypothetical protein [Nannocystis pusilla]|uniref:hypothetical protein n=1 Tax=Nannocystis pusilla TaxID=889268 RepID=UPI003B82AF08
MKGPKITVDYATGSDGSVTRAVPRSRTPSASASPTPSRPPSSRPSSSSASRSISRALPAAPATAHSSEPVPSRDEPAARQPPATLS